MKIFKKPDTIFSPGGPHKFTDSVLGRLRMYKQEGHQSSSVIGLDTPPPGAVTQAKGNILAYQVTAEVPFALDVVFQSGARSRARLGQSREKQTLIPK